MDGGASYPQFAMVVPHLRTVPPLAARCSVAAHCASLRVLATSALRASDVRKLTRGSPCFTGLIGGYCSHWLRRLFRPHWAYFGLFRALRAAFVRPTGCAASFALIGVFVPACASLARYSGAAERFALSSPLHPFGASTTTACFAHSARASCAPNFFSPS